MGSNIFESYFTRPRDYGWKIGSGVKANCMIAQATMTYELLPNVFIDADYIIRNYKQDNAADFKSNIFNVGLRMNLKRENMILV